jgi:hypothetical protein
MVTFLSCEVSGPWGDIIYGVARSADTFSILVIVKVVTQIKILLYEILIIPCKFNTVHILPILTLMLNHSTICDGWLAARGVPLYPWRKNSVLPMTRTPVRSIAVVIWIKYSCIWNAFHTIEFISLTNIHWNFKGLYVCRLIIEVSIDTSFVETIYTESEIWWLSILKLNTKHMFSSKESRP